MYRLVWLLIAHSWTVDGIIIIDSHEVEFDKNISNFSTTYRKDYDGHYLTNVSIRTFKAVTKGFLYFNVRCAADKNDREYKLEVIKTVIDAEKFYKGAQSNAFLKPFIEEIKQSLNIKISFPIPPVSSK